MTIYFRQNLRVQHLYAEVLEAYDHDIDVKPEWVKEGGLK